ncbi:hypothetical protein RND81_01G077300 [Saponaria officinalis]|uniref:Uncharacterized protein n=1 Tax=Saponaria officinalis TaxID=3572 RepID=A0AAW1NCU6_SAPOF
MKTLFHLSTHVSFAFYFDSSSDTTTKSSSETVYDNITELIGARFVDVFCRREKFLSSVAKRFRDFKAKLVSGWITKTRKRSKYEDRKEPPDIWKHIKVEDWRLFQQIKTMSPAKVIQLVALIPFG